MKKVASIFLLVAMIATMTIGCGNDGKNISKENKAQEETISVEDKEKNDVRLPSGEDFDTDVKAETLWVNNDGIIVDANGDPVREYRDMYRVEGQNILTDGENIVEGYAIDESGKIIFDIPEDVQSDNTELDSEPSSAGFSYGFLLQDVEDGKLYAKDHKIVDVDGNVVPDWDFIVVNGFNQLVVDGTVIDGFTVSDSGQIIRTDGETDGKSEESNQDNENKNQEIEYYKMTIEELNKNKTYVEMQYKGVELTGVASHVDGKSFYLFSENDETEYSFINGDNIETPSVNEIVTIKGIVLCVPGHGDYLISAQEIELTGRNIYGN